MDSIVGTTVTFTTFDADAWPYGTRLHAALDGYLDAQIPVSLYVGRRRDIADISVTFHVDPGSGIVEDEGAAETAMPAVRFC